MDVGHQCHVGPERPYVAGYFGQIARFAFALCGKSHYSASCARYAVDLTDARFGVERRAIGHGLYGHWVVAAQELGTNPDHTAAAAAVLRERLAKTVHFPRFFTKIRLNSIIFALCEPKRR